MPNKSETPADAEGVGQPKREASLAAPNGYAAGVDYHETKRIHDLRVALYNAACAYVLQADGPKSGDYDEAMRVSDALENAADAWAMR